MDLKEMNPKQLGELLQMTNAIADRNTGAAFAERRTTDADIQEAEELARAYAARRNANKSPRSDVGTSDKDKSIVEETRAWIEQKRKRGWWGRK